jgi:hypothetical protein
MTIVSPTFTSLEKQEREKLHCWKQWHCRTFAYHVGFSIAHQYMHQLDPDIRHAVLGNAGTIISFRVGAEDAPYLVREFVGKFAETDQAARIALAAPCEFN